MFRLGREGLKILVSWLGFFGGRMQFFDILPNFVPRPSNVSTFSCSPSHNCTIKIVLLVLIVIDINIFALESIKIRLSLIINCCHRSYVNILINNTYSLVMDIYQFFISPSYNENDCVLCHIQEKTIRCKLCI